MDKKNYGWVICAASTVVLFFLSGLATTGFVVYQPYLISIGGLAMGLCMSTTGLSAIIGAPIITMVTNHLSVLYRSVGIPSESIAGLLSCMGIALVIGLTYVAVTVLVTIAAFARQNIYRKIRRADKKYVEDYVAGKIAST